jgi:hypothetical protein
MTKVNTFFKPKPKEVIPYINDNYICESCGQTSGLSHPSTGNCFKCGADDWAPVNK